ncbi:MAG: membrane bound serine racemase VanT, partial [Acetatifactor sp.]|nr:membrane bound serine racemase VanT [Acetatifactor sp.]
LYGLLLRPNCPPCPRLRQISTLVYILHPAVIVAVRICARLPHLLPLMEQSLLHYLAVCLLSLAAAWLLSGLKDMLSERRNPTI